MVQIAPKHVGVIILLSTYVKFMCISWKIKMHYSDVQGIDSFKVESLMFSIVTTVPILHRVFDDEGNVSEMK
jgi:hypothetical protein